MRLGCAFPFTKNWIYSLPMLNFSSPCASSPHALLSSRTQPIFFILRNHLQLGCLCDFVRPPGPARPLSVERPDARPNPFLI